MSPLLWLVVAVGAGIGAYIVGWPAWTSSRTRQARDLNAERYLAWRGRAPRGARPPVSEGMTGEERRRLLIGALLAAVAVAGLVAFFVTS